MDRPTLAPPTAAEASPARLLPAIGRVTHLGPVHPSALLALPMKIKRQCGQGTIEFLLAAVPVLLLGLTSIEAVHWYFARQAVSHALVQAARSAITQNADPAVLDAAFALALLPLHAAPSLAESHARLQRNIARRTSATGLPAWRIRIISPTQASFADFASSNPELTRVSAQPTIDNDYLHEQHQARLAQGWPEGRGPLSGQTTLQANTLALHLTWLHEPLLPGVKNLLRQLAPADERYGSLAMARGGYLPIHREVALVMQSHPVQWAMPGHGRIVRHTNADTVGDQFSAHGTAPPPNGTTLPSSDITGHPDENTSPPAPPTKTSPGPAASGQSSGANGPGISAGHGTKPGHASIGAQSSCAGLWCLAPMAVGWLTDGWRNGGSGQDSATHGPGMPGPAENTAPASPYLDEAAPATVPDDPPADVEDCPGCCD